MDQTVCDNSLTVTANILLGFIVQKMAKREKLVTNIILLTIMLQGNYFNFLYIQQKLYRNCFLDIHNNK